MHVSLIYLEKMSADIMPHKFSTWFLTLYITIFCMRSILILIHNSSIVSIVLHMISVYDADRSAKCFMVVSKLYFVYIFLLSIMSIVLHVISFYDAERSGKCFMVVSNLYFCLHFFADLWMMAYKDVHTVHKFFGSSLVCACVYTIDFF